MGTSVADRSLLKRYCSRPASLDRRVKMRASPKDWQILSVLRKEFGKGTGGLSGIVRVALHALATKERLAALAMSKERGARLAAEERPMITVFLVYITLETKLCETCGRQFLRPAGSDVKHCAERHTAPVRPGDLQRLEAALMEGKEGGRRRKGARIRAVALG
jgi:hypothetical protein